MEVDEELQPEAVFLPPMLIQPFIENAIWHGVSHENARMQINIRFLQQNEQLLCIVEDTGIGIEASLQKKKDAGFSRRSYGIANVKERIQVLNEKYNLQSSVIIEDKCRLLESSGTGTIVTLYLSLKNTVL
jgi:sensor histidine kinase YesM